MILVTGAAGYIGSHCVLDLIKNGYDVVALDNLSTGHEKILEALGTFEAKGKVADFCNVDLRNLEAVSGVFKKHKIDTVIHFGAFSQVGESVLDPQKYYRNNVVGSLNLLDGMVFYDVKKIVFSSTAAVYGDVERVPIDEGDPKEPINPYGRTKLAVEGAITDYAKAYGLNYVIFRYFNVFGASSECVTGEWHDTETHLVPNILKSALGEGKEFELYGDDYPTPDGTCIRDYINVEDLAVAHRLASQYLKIGAKSQILNLGTERGHSVRDIFSATEGVLGKKVSLKVKPRREGDPSKLVASVDKAKKILNWQAEKTLNESIKTAYAWELKLKEEIK